MNTANRNNEKYPKHFVPQRCVSFFLCSAKNET